MPAGNILSNTNEILDHTQNTYPFRNTAGDGLWYSIIGDTSSSDWSLYRKDGATPETPATLGGWSQHVVVDTRSNNRLDGFYDAANNRLTIARVRDTDATWDMLDQWNWNAGAGVFQIDANVADIDLHTSLNLLSSHKINHVVDSNGVMWFQRTQSSSIIARNSAADRQSITQEVTVEGSLGTETEVRGMAFTFDKDVAGTPTPAVGVIYSDQANDRMRFAYRLDSDAVDAAWTIETIASSALVDDHIHVMAHRFAGDTESTIVYARKRTTASIVLGNPPTIMVGKRMPGGSWVSEVGVGGRQGSGDSSTRPKIVMDVTNLQLYLFYTDTNGDGDGDNTGRGVYQRVGDLATLTFGASTLAIENGSDIFQDVQTPRFPVTSDTNLMVLATKNAATSQIWYTEIPIAGESSSGYPMILSVAHRRRHVKTYRN